jgi:hypothetical protein
MRNLVPASTLCLALVLTLSGCVTGYTLVQPNTVSVSKNTMKVKAFKAWNKAPSSPYNIPQEETWTQNGPFLDSVTFIGGLKDGQAIAKQRPKDDRKVPVFRSGMSPQDLVSMIESHYRIKAGATVFETAGVVPAKLSGNTAVQFDYRYVGADEVKRRGRSVVAIVGEKLYLLSLDGAAAHYFEAALPEFEAMVASASIS